MAALGSILSWDEAEENDNVGNKSEDETTGALNERCNRQGLPAPFETLQFSTRNGMSGHNNYLYNSSTNQNNMQQNDSSSGNSNGMSFQQTMPATIQSINQQEQESQNVSGASFSLADGSTSAEQHQNQAATNQQQQSHMGMPFNLSTEQQQFIAQNPQAFAQFLANTVLQQQSQHLNANQNSQQPQQRTSLGPMFSAVPVQQPSQQVQQQKQQSVQQQQPQQPTQPTMTTDQNTLLQHFQMAQFQQQLQAAQAQQQPVASQPNMQLQSALQHLQTQFAHPQGNAAQPSSTQPLRIPSNEQSNVHQMQPSHATGEAPHVPSALIKPALPSHHSKKPKLNSMTTKKASTTPSMKTKTSKATELPMAGIVSASDTEGEMSRMAKASCLLEDNTDVDIDDIEFSNLSPSEKLKTSRDRNREHARNTRLRKKAYLEKLKLTVDELCRERDTLVSERAGAANLLVEMHNTRTEVLMSFMALRTSNERRRKLWSSILDECCFTCVMPVTPYRSFPASEVQVSKCLRTVLGIDGMISDTASLHVLLNSLVDRSMYPNAKIDFRYTLVTEEAVVAGNQLMARWVMSTTNAVQCGARMEVAKQGMLCCKFNSAHKIISIELMFDVMAFMLQLKQASGSEGFTVVPNTLQTCQRSFDKPMVMTHAEPPYTIIQVNKLWETMTGYRAEEVVGRASCAILQAPDMDKTSLTQMMEEVRYNRPASALLANRRKSGEDFTNFLVVYPLSTDSRISYFLGLTLYNANGKPCLPSKSSQGDSSKQIQKHTAQTSVATMAPAGVSVPGLLATVHGQTTQNQPMIPASLFPCLGSISNVCPPAALAQLCHTPFLQQGQVLQPMQQISFAASAIGTKRPRENDAN